MPDRKHLLRRADTAFYNERQKVTVDLTKTLEQEEIFGSEVRERSRTWPLACMPQRI